MEVALAEQPGRDNEGIDALLHRLRHLENCRPIIAAGRSSAISMTSQIKSMAEKGAAMAHQLTTAMIERNGKSRAEGEPDMSLQKESKKVLVAMDRQLTTWERTEAAFEQLRASVNERRFSLGGEDTNSEHLLKHRKRKRMLEGKIHISQILLSAALVKTGHQRIEVEQLQRQIMSERHTVDDLERDLAGKRRSISAVLQEIGQRQAAKVAAVETMKSRRSEHDRSLRSFETQWFMTGKLLKKQDNRELDDRHQTRLVPFEATNGIDVRFVEQIRSLEEIMQRVHWEMQQDQAARAVVEKRLRSVLGRIQQILEGTGQVDLDQLVRRMDLSEGNAATSFAEIGDLKTTIEVLQGEAAARQVAIETELDEPSRECDRIARRIGRAIACVQHDLTALDYRAEQASRELAELRSALQSLVHRIGIPLVVCDSNEPTCLSMVERKVHEILDMIQDVNNRERVSIDPANDAADVFDASNSYGITELPTLIVAEDLDDDVDQGASTFREFATFLTQHDQ